jgi:hypothetical protein
MRYHEIMFEAKPNRRAVPPETGVRHPIRNSEGKPIAETAEAQAAFWHWFGQSKIVDGRGRPMVVHRGDEVGKIDFNGVRAGNLINGNIFFSSNRAIAKGYTSHRTNSFIASKDMNQSHGLYSVYLKVLKPVVIDAKGKDWSRIPLSGEWKKTIGSDTIQIDELAQYVQQNTDSDGLIVKNVWDQFGDGHQYVVFSGQQIKLLPPADASPAPVAQPTEQPFRPVSYQWDDDTQDYVEVPDPD